MPSLTTSDISIRLQNQKLSNTNLEEPSDVVRWFGAMQAQEYAMSKWAIGLRLPKSSDAEVEKAFNDGRILRTHVLRPTWHFVAPEDIRWMLQLSAPRVKQAMAYMNRKLELDSKIFKRCNPILIKALEKEKFATREQLQLALSSKKITAKGSRLAHIMAEAELDQIICSGPRVGKKFTYALLDKRVPSTKPLTREDAISKLAHRFFTSRGPATVQDFAYWSWLTAKDAQAGAESLSGSFVRERMGKHEYIFIPPSSKIKIKPDTSFLMPDYDEYGMSYKDRSALLTINKLKGPKASIVFNRMLVIDGRIEGTWQRTLTKKSTEITIAPFAPLSKVEQQKVAKAIQRFQAFAE